MRDFRAWRLRASILLLAVLAVDLRRRRYSCPYDGHA